MLIWDLERVPVPSLAPFGGPKVGLDDGESERSDPFHVLSTDLGNEPSAFREPVLVGARKRAREGCNGRWEKVSIKAKLALLTCICFVEVNIS